MKYTYNYNPVRKVWTVWSKCGNTWETIKSFKTETAAKKFCEQHNG